MKKNVGKIDKIVRLVLALGLFSLFFFLEGNARYWALTGLIPLVTGLINFCPIWAIFGVNTCSLKTEA
ncbi:MAG: DUF2892 domain-containing protein [Candidatus Marinimicrobia bacterium]|nr:DUF2892 domain-containing protein [FCB group bacterium]MBL7026166.1 DUF2892 domain-containing protein [Candidatus Neomarinimicrobiota bacterium]